MIVTWHDHQRTHRTLGLGFVKAWSVQTPPATIVGLINSYTVSRQPSCVTTGRNLLSATDLARELGGTTTGQSG